MKPIKGIEEAIRSKLNVAAGPALHDRVLTRVRHAKEQSETTPALRESTMRRTIMRSPITKLAAAAVVTLAMAFGLLYALGPFQATTTAYGMTDLPQLLGDARTLHVQSTAWQYQADPNRPEFEQALIIPGEVWVDVPNLREHFISILSWTTPEGETGLNRVEGVRDGKYAMDINHTKKTVRFHEVSIVQTRLGVRDEIQRYLNHITDEDLAHFVRVGQENIKGTRYDIWEREDVDISHADMRKRIRCWLAPATGELGRIYHWEKSGDSRWKLRWCADTIERDADIPDSVFAFTAPEDYRYQNTLATAQVDPLGYGQHSMGRARVVEVVNFTLDDDTVILGWHSDDLAADRYQEQGPLFDQLVPGGELPKLPMVVYGLQTTRLESYAPPEITYVGRHLAFTKKNRWYYEWALYVPSRPLPSSKGHLLYHMLCRFNLANGQPPQVGNPLPDNKIKANEFDLFVREAMAELSDDGKAPEHVTYENVMRWANEARTSLAK